MPDRTARPRRPASGRAPRRASRGPWILSCAVHLAALAVLTVAVPDAAPLGARARPGRLEIRAVGMPAAAPVALPHLPARAPREVAGMPDLPHLPEAQPMDPADLPPETAPAPEALAPLPALDLPLHAARRTRPRRRARREAAASAPPAATGAEAPAPPPRPRRPRRRPGRPPGGAQPSTAPPARLRIVSAPDPRRFYPTEARRHGLGGRVLVALVIDARGRVIHARVQESSGHGLLDQAALALARRYRFTAGAGPRATRLPVTFHPPQAARGI